MTGPRPYDHDVLRDAVAKLLSTASQATYRRLLSAPAGTWLEVERIREISPEAWRDIADALAAQTSRWTEVMGRQPRYDPCLNVCWVPAPYDDHTAVVQFFEPVIVFWYNALVNLEYVHGPDR
jgi:hypothetical protein